MKLNKFIGFILLSAATVSYGLGDKPLLLASGDPSMIPPPKCGPAAHKAAKKPASKSQHKSTSEVPGATTTSGT